MYIKCIFQIYLILIFLVLLKGMNFTLLQILVCVSACAICVDFFNYSKGQKRGGKTNFFLHQPSIKPILSIRLFNFYNQVIFV